jgi:hypothetical protein
MSGDGLTRYYPQLTGPERSRLLILARARLDSAEEDRLFQTCPRMRYTGNDWTFIRHSMAAREVMGAFVLDSMRYLGWLDAIAMLNDPVEGLYNLLLKSVRELIDELEANLEASRDGDDVADEDDTEETSAPLLDEATELSNSEFVDTASHPLLAMDSMKRVAISILSAQWTAFDAVCREDMDLDGETVLRALWPGHWERMARYRPAMERAAGEPDERFVRHKAEWQELAHDIWLIALGSE